MSGRYAATTDVTVARRRERIIALLERYGADAFSFSQDGMLAAIQFRMEGRTARITVDLPDPDDDDFILTPTARTFRRPEAARKAWEQAVRQRYAALELLLQAKLEAIEIGLESFDSAFLANLVLPGGQTFGEHAIPQIDEIRISGGSVELLPQIPLALPAPRGGVG